MSTYRTVRGKLIALGGVHVAGHDDSSVHVEIGQIRMDLTELQAGRLYELLGDVLEWQSSEGTTETKLDKMAEDHG